VKEKPMTGDRNLLLGVIALQMDFISRDVLIEGLKEWVFEKQKPLGELLREKGPPDSGPAPGPQ
jgi:hypothetical protein